MFHSAFNWSARSLIAVSVSLVWIGTASTHLALAQDKGEAHAPAAAAPAAAPAHAEGAAHAAPAPAGDGHQAGAPHGDAPHGDDHHAAAGAPNPMDWKTDLALWSLITFGLFVVILKIFAWGPLSSALNSREHKIKGDIAHAEEARVKAEKMLVEYQAKLAAAQEEVLKTLAEARRDAEHTRQEIMSQTEKDVAATKERAIQEIERTKDAALEELFGHLAGTVANATERVLGRALTDADQERLIGDALAEFSRGQAS